MTIEAHLIDNMLRDPKSSQSIFQLPCGYLQEVRTESGDVEKILHREVHLREMTGEEEDLLGADMPFDRKMNAIMTGCIERLGNLTDKKDIAKGVVSLLEGDRFFLFFALRRVSIGDYYPFKDTCPSCRKTSVQNYNLANLRIYEMENPEERVQSVQLPSGTYVKVRCLDGRDDQRRTQLKPHLRPLSLSIFLRLVEFDGRPPTVDDVKAMTQRDRAYLRGFFVDMDGGIETEISLICPKCSHEYQRDIDPGNPGFFSPSETLNVWKRKSGI